MTCKDKIVSDFGAVIVLFFLELWSGLFAESPAPSHLTKPTPGFSLPSRSHSAKFFTHLVKILP
jgi:hypothetical protein